MKRIGNAMITVCFISGLIVSVAGAQMPCGKGMGPGMGKGGNCGIGAGMGMCPGSGMMWDGCCDDAYSGYRGCESQTDAGAEKEAD